MSVTVRIPTPLRPFTDSRETVECDAATVHELLETLSSRYDGLATHLFDEGGRLRSFVNLYVNEQDIRALASMDTALEDRDVVSIVPSIAGGAPELAQRAEPVLSNAEVAHYSRHLIMPEVAMEGQKKLKRGSVLLVGTGGLGAPLGMYLAAAGVGRIGLVDFDVVEASNLHRQVTFSVADVGRSKTEAASDRLSGINPHVRIDRHDTRLTSSNALDLLADYDVIVDGTDNFPTRYLVNDASVLLGKPNVYGSIFRFEGQVSVFDARVGPCYRCLYPEPPPPGLVPSCAEGGVLGVLPGIVGSLQACEVIKLLLGAGEPLIGRLVLFDALAMSLRELRQFKNPDCVLCGDSATQTELIDYESFCGVAPSTGDGSKDAAASVPSISVEALRDARARGDDLRVIDVREPHEWDIAHLEGATLIPLGELATRLDELSTSQAYVLQCRSGARSAKATRLLLDAGFGDVRNLDGGILAWADRIDTSVPKY